MEQSYTKENFDVKALGGNDITSNVKDGIARFRNTLVIALRRYNCIPKMIVIVPENDLIKAIGKQGFGTGVHFETTLTWIMSEFESIMQTYIKFTPNRVRKGKTNWPYFLWMSPSLHDNYEEIDYQLRKKFTQNLENIVQKKETTAALRLKTVWNPRDLSLFSFREKRFTQHGWKTFWESIDKSIQFMDTKLIPEIIYNIEQRKKEAFRSNDRDDDHNKSNRERAPKHWTRDRLHHGQPAPHRRSYDNYHYRRDGGYKLPPPPPK